jgi:hypothetical protein
MQGVSSDPPFIRSQARLWEGGPPAARLWEASPLLSYVRTASGSDRNLPHLQDWDGSLWGRVTTALGSDTARRL